MKTSIKHLGILVVFVLAFAFAFVVEANHTWGLYHWARTSNPFQLKLGDNVSGQWDTVLATASADWSLSSVLDTIVVPGLSNSKTCKPVAGRVEVCNSKYGNNGWLGIAQIWITGGEHITQGVTKLNDTYFNTTKYNTVAWRNLVTCQEIGHTFGLDHQDEGFDSPNLGTCMDYTNNPATNQHPNAHDYEQLETMYAHFDSITTVLSNITSINRGGVDTDNPASWGKAIAQDKSGKDSIFEKDLGSGNKVITHVFWVE
jgi:hypothetical protein